MILKGMFMILFIGASNSDPTAEGERTSDLGIPKVTGDSNRYDDKISPKNVAQRGNKPYNEVHGFERRDQDLDIEFLVGQVHLATGAKVNLAAINKEFLQRKFAIADLPVEGD